MTSSASTKRGRRRYRAKRRVKGLALEMNGALGEFLTESGRVEFKILLFVDQISEAPIEHLFDESSPLTLSKKIEWFKHWCEFSGISDQKRPLLQKVYNSLDDLLTKRNYLVHGETWEGSFNGQPMQSYRVGMIKDNIEYLDEFDRGQRGYNVFSLNQVRDVSAECRQIIADLEALTRPH